MWMDWDAACWQNYDEACAEVNIEMASLPALVNLAKAATGSPFHAKLASMSKAKGHAQEPRKMNMIMAQRK